MHHVLVKDNKVAHVWRGPIPKGISNTFAVAPGSAHVGDDWDSVAMSAVPKAPSITIDEINAECERRILELYPLARQLNILDEGSQAELQEFKDRRNGLRASARALAMMNPIPVNFRDDRFWSSPPFGGYAGGYGQQQNHGMANANGMGMQMLPGYGGAHTNQPIIMMQAQPAAAPIIINGASPGTTVIQGPAQVQQPQTPQINLVSPQPQQVTALPHSQSATPSAPQAKPMGLPAPSNDTPPTHPVSAIDKAEIIYETAARALSGQDTAIAYMTNIANAKGTDWKALSEALMKERFDRFDKVLKEAAQ